MLPILKQPNEEIVIELRYGDQISAVMAVNLVSVTPRGWAAGAPLVVLSQVIDGAAVKLKLGGGADGEAYLIKGVVSGDAQIYEADADVQVVDLGFTLPDGTHPYLSPRDYIDRYGYEETVRLTDEQRTGKIDKRRLFAAMSDAQASIDSYIAARYALPLSLPVPPMVASLFHILTRANLHRDADASHPAKQAETHTLKALEQIAKGMTRLVGAAPADVPVESAAQDNEVLISGDGPVNTSSSLQGF
jgi:phage gp36-like protein